MRGGRSHPGKRQPWSRRTSAVRRCAGIVRVARPTESGSGRVLPANGGKIDQRVGPALGRQPLFAPTHPVTERIDRRLHQRAALGVELTTEDEHAPIGLLALEPAAFVGAVVIGEHPIGVEAQPGGLGEHAHGPGLKRLRRAHQDVLEGRQLRHADILGEVGDHGHVAEGGAPGTSAVERGRQLSQGPGQVDAVAAAFTVIPQARRSQDTVLPPPSAWAPRSR